MLDIAPLLPPELLELSRQAAQADLYRYLSALMYIVFAAGLFYLGSQYQRAIVRGENPPGQFPKGYFTMLIIQLLPLTISGFALHDDFIIGTRGGTLAVVAVVYGLVASKDGTFASWRYVVGVIFWLSLAVMGTMLWNSHPEIRLYLRDHETLVSTVAMVAMIAFVVFGQGVTAKELYRHYMSGNYSVKRLSLQFVRLFAFASQALHYAHVHSGAKELVWSGLGYTVRFDPIFMTSALGTLGVVFVLIWSFFGFLVGSDAREMKRNSDRTGRHGHVFGR